MDLLNKNSWIVLLVFCFLSLIFFFMLRTVKEQDLTGRPSKAKLAEDMAPVAQILGGESRYVDRQIRRSLISETNFDKLSFADAVNLIESMGWYHVTSESRGSTIQYKYCRGRLAFVFETDKDNRLSYGIIWETQPRAFAYCK